VLQKAIVGSHLARWEANRKRPGSLLQGTFKPITLGEKIWAVSDHQLLVSGEGFGCSWARVMDHSLYICN
jgi:hypothetical protein